MSSGAGLAGYQFDNCRLDLDRGYLVCHEKDHQLRYQTFQVLLYFLQHPGVLITKDELTEAIWKNSHVSDNALVQCIAEIRRALEDDPKNPRFIKTIPRVGYRFLPAVIPCENCSAPSIAPEEAIESAEGAEQNPVPAITVANGLEDRNPVPLSTFNRFDPDISTPTPLRIARWAVPLCVFLLVLTAVGIRWKGFRARHATATVAAQEDDKSPTVAVTSFKNGAHQPNHLGVEQQPQPTPSELGTNNAEAYRYYSLGAEKAQTFQNAEAIDLLKKAVALDPKFAMAYARIGYTYAVADFVPQKGLPYLERATQLSTSLPEKERLYIEAWRAVAKADYARATQLFDHITESYPEESEAYRQLGHLLERQEKSAEAVVVLKRGLKYHSDENSLYNDLGMSLMDLNQYDAAVDAEQHQVALSPQDPNAHDSLGMSYQRAGSYDAAVSEYDIALSLNPEFEPSTVHLGDVAFEQGRYREALHEYERYVQIAHSSDARAIGYGDLATVYRALGERSAAERAAENEMKNNPDAVWNALVLASDEKDAPKVARFEEILLQHLTNHERGSPPDLRTQIYDRAYLDLKRGDQQLAIAEFKTALQHLPPSSAIDLHEDCLANAYMQSGMLNEAAAEYRRILQLNANYPLAQYHLGEIYSRMGDQTKASVAFAQFLRSWQSADQDLPEVVRAKSALATFSASSVHPTSTTVH